MKRAGVHRLQPNIPAGVLLALVLVSPGASLAASGRSADALVQEVSATDLLRDLGARKVTSEALVRAYLDRIARVDRAGPKLYSVLAVNPDALSQARQLDAERKAGKVRGALHGLPVLIKDNIESRDPVATTAGSLALQDNITGRDATAIARLRDAGAVILGKTNLSEWANMRDPSSLSSWSGIGGLTKNPYVLNRSACGSSGGAGASLAASLAPLGIGTETDGSVVCPASMNGVVGLKPSVGLVSRTHVVPITHSQDTLGPMARNVRDVALLFSVMVGSDAADPSTRDADRYRKDFAAALSADALKGVRLGVIRPATMTRWVAERYEAALERLRSAGALLVDVQVPKAEGMREAELKVFEYEFKAHVNDYLASLPAAVKTRTLADVIAFNKAHAVRELGVFGQRTLETADRLDGLDSQEYRELRARSLALARESGLDVMLAGLDALVAPTGAPASIIDPSAGSGNLNFGTPFMPAIAGYPHLSVPMGLVRGVPMGLSFIGRAFSDGDLLRYGYAFEATGPLREPPRYLATFPIGDLFEPLREAR